MRTFLYIAIVALVLNSAACSSVAVSANSNKYMYDHIPWDPARTLDNSPAATVEAGDYLTFHVCWCGGIKVKEYDKTNFVPGKFEEFNVYKDKLTGDLVIVSENLAAFYSAEEDFTYTLANDGLQALRTAEYSIYWYSTGNAIIRTVNSDDEAIYLIQNGKYLKEIPGNYPVSLEEVDRLKMKLSAELSKWLLHNNLLWQVWR
jgi:hypothetical protein